MEARKRFMSFDTTKLLDPPRPSYTFSIYNRDLFEKSKFKDYDSLLEHRLVHSQARANHLALILENGNVTRPHSAHESKRENGKVPTSTSIEFANGEYVASFILGTDQIKRLLLIDTGSDLTWWQCGPCRPNKCYAQKHEPLYDFTKSKTYQKLDCLAQSTSCVYKSKVYDCIPYDNTCIYDYKYADGARTRGWIADEVITFVLDSNPVKILFGSGRDQTNGTAFSGEYSGIAGLGRRVNIGSFSLPSQLKVDIMALCLPEFYSTKPSTLSFHTTPYKKKTSARLIPNYKLPTFYFVNLYKVLINDKEVPSFPSFSLNIGNGMTGGCIVDTGSIVTNFPTDFYDEFRDTFRKEAGDIPLYDAPYGDFDTCYMVDPGVVPTFPVVKMYFDHQNPENLLLLEQKRVVVHERGLFCLAFISWDQNIAIIGSYQLQGIGLTFDTATDTLSFELDACN
ncbi:hypothetical protein H5410_035099 [Solanum commersonii]|uniref:Peptidase A1 domain-containing protein n=1 Tax=Solanum commersonii TaxID=4109 RepID=A0A9J5XZS1_SOLCO|nr:hypothetical protein H5410_035099 [Solanum commersonii]